VESSMFRFFLLFADWCACQGDRPDSDHTVGVADVSAYFRGSDQELHDRKNHSCRDTSLMRNRVFLRPYIRPLPRALWWS
jgi:hypothetical protein